MNKPVIGMRGKKISEIMETNENERIVHPEQCKNCGSKNIIGRGMVIGMSYINLDTMEVDELGDDFEIYDEENLSYRCFECGKEWEL